MTTPLETYQALLRGVERLNPKRLGGSGWVINSSPCIIATLRISLAEKGRVEPARLADAVAAGGPLAAGFSGKTMDHAMSVNDMFRRGDNSHNAQEARWKHMHAWLTSKIVALQKEDVA